MRQRIGLPGGFDVRQQASIFTKLRLKKGTFSSVDELEEAIGLWVEHWNDDPKPFVWKKPADESIAEVKPGQATLVSTKSAAHP